MKTAAIIQARMRSTRLPGKVLREIAGRPILGHIVDRLRACRLIDDIALTIPDGPEDDALIGFAAEEGIAVFRGPEDDVLKRFALATDYLDPDVIVRVTGDSPILEPALIDHMIAILIDADADHLIAEPGERCAQEGVDPLSRRALKRLLADAAENPVAREHVTGYLKAHPDFAKAAPLPIDATYRFGGARLSIDTPEDLKFQEAAAERNGGRLPGLQEMISLLKKEPWLMTINAHVKQKAASDISGVVLIRADGGGTLGQGHLRRMCALAAELRAKAGLGVVALTGVHREGSTESARRIFDTEAIPVLTPSPGETEFEFIAGAIRRTRAKGLVLDVRTELSEAETQRLSAMGPVIVSYDDASPRYFAADLAVFPPVPQAVALKAGRGAHALEIGWPMVMVSPAIAAAAHEAKPRLRSTPPKILVSMGGSDPRRWTLKTVDALTRAFGEKGACLRAIVAGTLPNAEEVAAALRKRPHVESLIDPPDLAAAMADADLALVSYGVTAFELAAMGVPALYLCLTSDHFVSASAAVDARFGRVAGGPGPIDWRHVGALAKALHADKALCEEMSQSGRRAIDGLGAERLALAIQELIRLRMKDAPEAASMPQQMPPASLRAAGL